MCSRSFAATNDVRALVTGGSGFLGGHLVRMLLAQGAGVTILARPDSRISEHPGVSVLREAQGESASSELRQVLGATTHIFHCAGCSTDWAPLPEYHEANVSFTARMMRLAQEHAPRLERLVHVSTTDVYGYPRQAGDEALPLVATPLPYNRTKLLADQLAQRAFATDGLPVTIVRPSSIYGRGGKAFVTDIVGLLRQRLMLLVDGGTVRGGFVHVDDVCRAMLLAAVVPQALGRAYNVSSLDGVTWRDYTHALAKAVRLPAPWLRLPFRVAMAAAGLSQVPHALGVPGRPLLTRHAVYLLGRDQQYAVDRAWRELGWRPEILLEDGIRRSVAS